MSVLYCICWWNMWLYVEYKTSPCSFVLVARRRKKWMSRIWPQAVALTKVQCLWKVTVWMWNVNLVFLHRVHSLAKGSGQTKKQERMKGRKIDQRKENSSKKANHRIHSTSTGEWSNKEKRTNERRKKKSKLKKSKKEQSPYRPDQHWGCFSSSRHLKHGRSLLSGSWTGKNGE